MVHRHVDQCRYLHGKTKKMLRGTSQRVSREDGWEVYYVFCTQLESHFITFPGDDVLRSMSFQATI